MIFNKLIGLFSNDLSIDLGTANTIVIAKGRGMQTKKLDILFSEKIKLFAPALLFKELNKQKNLEDIKFKSGFSDEDLKVFIKILEFRIDIVSNEELSDKISEAEEVSTHTKDTLYFAAALKKNCPIWSGEKRFKKQTRVEVFNTKDLANKFGL